VTSIGAKYAALADGFAEREYADPAGYARRRARIIATLGPPLAPGATVLDLCCADGIMTAPLLAYGVAYTGVDASPEMLDAARRRNPGVEFREGRMEEYEPPQPVDVTVCLRSFYLAPDRVAFFRRVLGYTRVMFVFDFRPAEYPADGVLRDLRAAGCERFELRPFFMSQRHSMPGPAQSALEALERTGPLASLVSRRFGPTFCCATIEP